MPGIREVASEAGGEDVTRALRRPCSGVPRGEAARVARAPSLPSGALCPPPPPASRTPTSWARRAHPTLPFRASPHLRLARLGGAGPGGRSGSGLFWASPRSGRGPAGGRSASGGGGGSGVPRRPGFGVRSHHDGKVTAPPRAPGRWAPWARAGAPGAPGWAGLRGRTPASPDPCGHPGLTRPLPGWQRWSSQGRLPRSRVSSPLAGPGQRQVNGLCCPGRRSHYHTRPLLPRTSAPRGQGLAQGHYQLKGTASKSRRSAPAGFPVPSLGYPGDRSPLEPSVSCSVRWGGKNGKRSVWGPSQTCPQHRLHRDGLNPRNSPRPGPVSTFISLVAISQMR